MEKFINYTPAALVLSFFTKGMIVGFDAVGLGVISVLSVIFCLAHYLDKRKSLQDIQTIVNKQNEVIEKMAKEIVEIKTSVTAAKMQQGFTTSRKVG